MTMALPTTAVAVFLDHAEADKAVTDLRQADFTAEQIGVAVRQDKGAVADAEDVPPETKTAPGAIAGVLTGGALGGLAGAVVVGVIPGIRPVIAASLLAGILGGAGAGATAGGVLGALIGHGVSEEDARHYEKKLAAGKTIVTVKSKDRHDEAVAILPKHGALGKGSPPGLMSF